MSESWCSDSGAVLLFTLETLRSGSLGILRDRIYSDGAPGSDCVCFSNTGTDNLASPMGALLFGTSLR